jgi:uncharacterized protein YjbI with pentapeptide repeats
VEPEKTPRKRAEELIRLLVSDWRPTPQQGLWAIRIAIVLGLLVAIGYSYGITLWDWAQLLIVPAVIAGGVAWLNGAQRQREREDEVAQQQRQQRAEEARRKRELDIADLRAQDEALQAYLDQMSHMLTNKERPLRRAQPGDDLSVVAQARTLTVLTKLHKERKGRVVQFLYESGLITKDRRILNLSKAELFMADLRRANLSEANLHGGYLVKANLIEADLVKADLSRANLSNAWLSHANLSEANLSEANLSNARLRHANLSSARGLTNEQIAAARTLEGAIMPDGRKYEHWLRSQGRAEDGENSGPS